MKRIFMTAGIAALALNAGVANAADYTIDSSGAHASINFKVSHLGYSFIKGRFNKFDGQFSYDAENVSDAKVMVNVDTTSLDTNHAERDKHLRSGDFIDASKYSNAKFVSTEVINKGDGDIVINGDLTLHGKTQPISIDASVIGEGQDPWGGYRAGFMGSTRLELADFDINVMGTSSYVDMELHIEGIKQ
jgi:polyisoprenoid-binding protein YceI